MYGLYKLKTDKTDTVRSEPHKLNIEYVRNIGFYSFFRALAIGGTTSEFDAWPRVRPQNVHNFVTIVIGGSTSQCDTWFRVDTH